MTASSPPMSEIVREQRSHLLSIAYRMLGSVAEAEDAVQEAFLRFEKEGLERIDSPRGWLTTALTRICLDVLKSARVKREMYVGPWLPEPVRTDAESALAPHEGLEQRESLSSAFLLLLESLSPVERAVFLLHEAFDYSHGEVAEMLNKEEAAVRQILHRARARVRDGRPRFELDANLHRHLLERFLQATRTGDVDALKSMLADQAIARTDGGGQARAALKLVRGGDAVARFVVGVAKKGPQVREMVWMELNGVPGVALVGEHGGVVATLSLAICNGRIEEVHVVVAPDKLRRLMPVHDSGALSSAR